KVLRKLTESGRERTDLNTRKGKSLMTGSKILVLDIEWAPATAYVWRMYDENISPEQLIDEGGLLCFSAHWLGSKEYQFYSRWKDGDESMALAAYKLLSEADAVVTYNG